MCSFSVHRFLSSGVFFRSLSRKLCRFFAGVFFFFSLVFLIIACVIAVFSSSSSSVFNFINTRSFQMHWRWKFFSLATLNSNEEYQNKNIKRINIRWRRNDANNETAILLIDLNKRKQTKIQQLQILKWNDFFFCKCIESHTNKACRTVLKNHITQDYNDNDEIAKKNGTNANSHKTYIQNFVSLLLLLCCTDRSCESTWTARYFAVISLSQKRWCACVMCHFGLFFYHSCSIVAFDNHNQLAIREPYRIGEKIPLIRRIKIERKRRSVKRDSGISIRSTHAYTKFWWYIKSMIAMSLREWHFPRLKIFATNRRYE